MSTGGAPHPDTFFRIERAIYKFVVCILREQNNAKEVEFSVLR